MKRFILTIDFSITIQKRFVFHKWADTTRKKDSSRGRSCFMSLIERAKLFANEHIKKQVSQIKSVTFWTVLSTFHQPNGASAHRLQNKEFGSVEEWLSPALTRPAECFGSRLSPGAEIAMSALRKWGWGMNCSHCGVSPGTSQSGFLVCSHILTTTTLAPARPRHSGATWQMQEPEPHHHHRISELHATCTPSFSILNRAYTKTATLLFLHLFSCVRQKNHKYFSCTGTQKGSLK